jgi:hypothetical protein
MAIVIILFSCKILYWNEILMNAFSLLHNCKILQ